MLKINRYVDISEIDREAKRDYIDRHSPFITAPSKVKAGEIFEVHVKVGNEYAHPDDLDHYIANVALYNRQVQLAYAEFKAGMLGGQGHKGHAEVSFKILAQGRKMVLTALAYCTKHGLWEGDPITVEVES